MSDDKPESVVNIYTYVVDHGKYGPTVGSKSIINGGKLNAVMFGDALRRLEEVHEFLAELRGSTMCDKTKFAIDDFMN